MQQKQYSELGFSKFGDFFQIKKWEYYNNIPLFSFISHIFWQKFAPNHCWEVATS
jgi:hypothetical protein